ncbi:MAG: COX20 family protein [Candidatus Micrarchaeota archaeon]|nr:COX20 family protein [Candidatus Micrarchaeota archaeon]
MGRITYAINAFFGLLVGFVVIVAAGIYPMLIGRFSTNAASWLIGGIIVMAFGYYELIQYRKAKNK